MQRLLALVCAGVMILSTGSAFDQAVSALAPEHKEWLDDVTPILTPAEREVFLALKSDRERIAFIRLFWKQRDPLPDTEENEFQKAYLARILEADKAFGMGQGKRGSRTEMGFFYRILGAPLERQRFVTQSDVVPMELWYFKGDVRFGLPSYFYLLFYQPMGMGEFRLYYPGVEGPEKLVISSMSRQTLDRTTAYQLLRRLNTELAAASMSYLPGDRPQTATSFSSDLIIAGIRELPKKQVSDAYARKYMTYKDYIETEHSETFVDSAFQGKLFRQGGASFLHWTLELSRVNFAERDGRISAAFELVLRVESLQGKTILESTEEIPLRITAEQYKEHERGRFALQDLLPLIPGEYRIHFLLKNKTGKDFTSQEIRATVPPETGPPALGSLILYRAKEPDEAAGSGVVKAFSLDGFQFLFDMQNEFSPEAKLGLYVQTLNFDGTETASLRSAVAEIRKADTGEIVLSRTAALAEARPAGRLGLDFPDISLAEIAPGYYQASVALVDEAGQTRLSQKEFFTLLARPGRPLPWTLSRRRPSFPNAGHLAVFGSEFYAAGRLEAARSTLERSLALQDAPGTKHLLAKTLLGLKSYTEALALAGPLFQATRDREAARVLAQAHAGLRDWASALVFAREFLNEAAEPEVLNLAAEALIRLNRPGEALPLLRKSLELQADQSRARQLEEEAKSAIK